MLKITDNFRRSSSSTLHWDYTVLLPTALFFHNPPPPPSLCHSLHGADCRLNAAHSSFELFVYFLRIPILLCYLPLYPSVIYTNRIQLDLYSKWVLAISGGMIMNIKTIKMRQSECWNIFIGILLLSSLLLAYLWKFKKSKHGLRKKCVSLNYYFIYFCAKSVGGFECVIVWWSF